MLHCLGHAMHSRVLDKLDLDLGALVGASFEIFTSRDERTGMHNAHTLDTTTVGLSIACAFRTFRWAEDPRIVVPQSVKLRQFSEAKTSGTFTEIQMDIYIYIEREH